MNTYRIKLEVDAEVQAFSEEDAADYINDIFGVDDEVKSVKVISVKPLSNAERRAIETFLEGANDLDDIVMRTVRLLAQVTKQVAVVQYPSLTKSRVRHIELVLLTPTRLMMVLITTTGRVEQRVLELPYELNEQLLGDLRHRLNGAVTGKSMTDVASQLESILAAFGRNERTSTALIISNLIEMPDIPL